METSALEIRQPLRNAEFFEIVHTMPVRPVALLHASFWMA
jgi:hypothetical protein